MNPIQCHNPASIVLQVVCLSDLIPWFYLSLPLYNHKGFDLSHIWMVSWFSHFLQFKSEFSNKEFMISAVVSSQSYFCWLYRASASLAAKNMINLILVLTIWWCTCVESYLCVVGRECLLWPVCSLSKALLAFASFCTPRWNLSVTPGVSWLPTFAFQSPIMKRTSFLGVSYRRFSRSA